MLKASAAGPEAVLQSKLVHISHGRGPAWGEFSWHEWARALRLKGKVPATGPTVTAEHLAVDLVLAEDVLALVSLVNASRLLADGMVARCSRYRSLVGMQLLDEVEHRGRTGREDFGGVPGVDAGTTC